MSNYICPKCGNPISENTNFCTKCGAPVQETASQPKPQTQSQTKPQPQYDQHIQNTYRPQPPAAQQSQPGGNFLQDKLNFNVKNLAYSPTVSIILSVLAGLMSLLSMIMAPMFQVKVKRGPSIAVGFFGKHSVDNYFEDTLTIGSIFFVICATLLVGAVLFMIFKKAEYALIFSILYGFFMLIYFIAASFSLNGESIWPHIGLFICGFCILALIAISIVNMFKIKDE